MNNFEFEEETYQKSSVAPSFVACVFPLTSEEELLVCPFSPPIATLLLNDTISILKNLWARKEVPPYAFP